MFARIIWLNFHSSLHVLQIFPVFKRIFSQIEVEILRAFEKMYFMYESIF